MRVPPNVEPGGAFGSIEDTDLTARLVTLIVAAALTPGCLVIDDMHPLTPLAAAARAGDLREIDRLVAAGADVNAGSGVNSWPPLLHAIHRDQMAAVARLLAHGASIEGQSGVEAVKLTGAPSS
jgi:ankyrin repeat protein